MIGSFGVIEESIGDNAEELTHAERFGRRSGNALLRQLKWSTGRDLLLVDTAVIERTSPNALPPRPKQVSDQELWIPVTDDDAQVVGPLYRVGTTTRGALIRVRAELDIHFVPELLVVAGGRRARVLGAIDLLDPSRRRQLEKVVQATPAERLDAQLLFPGKGGVAPAGRQPGGSRSDHLHAAQPHTAERRSGDLQTGDPHTANLPPAARTILHTIETSPLGSSHVLHFERRGAGGLLAQLEGRDLIRVLSSGQIVSVARYGRLRETLAESGPELAARTMAGIWDTSVGMAGALLDAFALDGMLDRASARNYKRKDDAPG